LHFENTTANCQLPTANCQLPTANQFKDAAEEEGAQVLRVELVVPEGHYVVPVHNSQNMPRRLLQSETFS